MADFTEKDRATDGRGPQSGAKVKLDYEVVGIVNDNGVRKVLIAPVKPKPRPIVLDEMTIQPRRKKPEKDPVPVIAPVDRGPDKADGKPREPEQPSGAAPPPTPVVTVESLEVQAIDAARAQAIAEARAVADRFGQGQDVTARQAGRTGTRVVELEGKSQRAGADGSEPSVVGEVISRMNEIGMAQLGKSIKGVEDSLRKSNRVARGQPATSTGDLSQKPVRVPRKKLQHFAATALAIERQQALLGEKSLGGMEQARKLRAIARRLIEKEIESVVDSANRGESFGTAYLEFLSIALVGSQRSEGLDGARDEATSERIMPLTNVQRLPLDDEARDVLHRATSGQGFDDMYVDYLRQRLDETGEADLSGELRRMQASQFEAEVDRVLADSNRGRPFEEYDVVYLKDRADKLAAEEADPSRRSRWTTLSEHLDRLLDRPSSGSRDSPGSVGR